MGWVATAIIVGGTSAVVGAVASNAASKRAAEGQKNALAASTAAADSARTDINRLFGDSASARERGFGNALDFISGAPSQQIAPFQAGNMLAQQQVSRGLPQIQNALMGNPIDLSGFQSRSIGTPESYNFDLSKYKKPAKAASPAPYTPAPYTPEWFMWMQNQNNESNPWSMY